MQTSSPTWIEITTILISVVALGVSIWAIAEARRGRAQDQRIKLRNDIQQLKVLTHGLPDQCAEAKRQWQFAARGTLQSSVREQKDKRADDLAARTEDLRARSDELPDRLNGLSSAEVEELHGTVSGIRAEAEAIAADVTKLDARARENAAEARRGQALRHSSGP